MFYFISSLLHKLEDVEFCQVYRFPAKSHRRRRDGGAAPALSLNANEVVCMSEHYLTEDQTAFAKRYSPGAGTGPGSETLESCWKEEPHELHNDRSYQISQLCTCF